MRKLFKGRKLIKGGNYMRKYGMFNDFYILPWETVEFVDKLSELSL